MGDLEWLRFLFTQDLRRDTNQNLRMDMDY